MNRTKCSLACKTSALESLQRTSKRSLIRSTPPNRKGWEWDWLSAGRLLRIMVESYGPRRMTVPEQHFNLRFQRTSRGINAGPRYLSLLKLTSAERTSTAGLSEGRHFDNAADM